MKEYIKLRHRIIFNAVWSLTYYKDSKCKIYHREDDKPAIIWNDGNFYHYENGQCLLIMRLPKKDDTVQKQRKENERIYQFYPKKEFPTII
jgi:hypothetical protein